jgi:hypothetical protein
MYEIIFAEGVEEDLAKIRAFDRTKLLDAIDRQLIHEPCQETRNKKLLASLKPPWNNELPIWEPSH